jgi:hypothetical protein
MTGAIRHSTGTDPGEEPLRFRFRDIYIGDSKPVTLTKRLVKMRDRWLQEMEPLRKSWNKTSYVETTILPGEQPRDPFCGAALTALQGPRPHVLFCGAALTALQGPRPHVLFYGAALSASCTARDIIKTVAYGKWNFSENEFRQIWWGMHSRLERVPPWPEERLSVLERIISKDDRILAKRTIEFWHAANRVSLSEAPPTEVLGEATAIAHSLDDLIESRQLKFKTNRKSLLIEKPPVGQIVSETPRNWDLSL